MILTLLTYRVLFEPLFNLWLPRERLRDIRLGAEAVVNSVMHDHHRFTLAANRLKEFNDIIEQKSIKP